MKITAAQLRSIIKEEVSRVLREAPLTKRPVRPGAVYLGKFGRTPIEISIEHVGDDGIVYFTQTMSGKQEEKDMWAKDFKAYLANPKYGFELSHQE